MATPTEPMRDSVLEARREPSVGRDASRRGRGQVAERDVASQYEA